MRALVQKAWHFFPAKKTYPFGCLEERLDYVEQVKIIQDMPDTPEHPRPPFPEKDFMFDYKDSEHSTDSAPSDGSSSSGDDAASQGASSSSGEEEEAKTDDVDVAKDGDDYADQDVHVDIENMNDADDADVRIR